MEVNWTEGLEAMRKADRCAKRGGWVDVDTDSDSDHDQGSFSWSDNEE